MKELPDISGKAGQILTLEYALWESSKQYRHDEDVRKKS